MTEPRFECRGGPLDGAKVVWDGPDWTAAFPWPCGWYYLSRTSPIGAPLVREFVWQPESFIEQDREWLATHRIEVIW